MNQPPYILTDVFKDIVTDMKAKLVAAGVLTELNYQFGYVKELVQTLAQMKEPGFIEKKFPLVFLSQPFEIIRGEEVGWFGTTRGLDIFLVVESDRQMKAVERMEVTFKPLLYKMYSQLLQSIAASPAISTFDTVIPHVLTDRYWWGDQQQSVLNDIVDCMHLSEVELRVNNNSNCQPTAFSNPA